ncbi:MAG: SpoIIE family protein phosphatase [Bdellovibrionaceae bacterium]|nr:SpoIIE family protein phosphatase [Bdellovibrionales bacterium]MCB9084096.1 SpoIIE family protein phosphatase [Pseudobdellovibrionaceae bacterium]
MKWFKKLPLRFKLLTLMVSVTSVTLLVYSYLALNGFEEDKVAYVFDTSRAHVQAVANQVRSDLEFTSAKVQFFMRGYQSTKAQFHPYTLAVLPTDPFIEALWVYHFDEASGSYSQKASAGEAATATKWQTQLQNNRDQLIKSALESEISLASLPQSPGYWVLGLRYSQPQPLHPVVVLSLIRKGSYLDFFHSPQIQDTYLSDQHNNTVINPVQPTYVELTKPMVAEALAYLKKENKAPTTVFEWSPKSASSDSPWLMASAKIGIGGLQVVSFVPKKAALATVRLLIFKSSLFLILLIGLASLLSVVGAHHLTDALKRLFEATHQVAQGDFDLEIEVESEDEVGGLTRGFNHMTQEIKRLLAETAEKARMETELATAKTVQATLFPEAQFHSGPVEIKGYYEPASECGGDWWYYNKVGSKTFLWIGDATGHGVPAALVTSAARSASRILEEMPELSLSKVLSLLNKAINGTSKGQVNMTFFLASFDEQTGKLEYCNASHDPPLVIPHKEDKISKADIKPLIGAKGPRLGESPDSEYSQEELQLNPGDRLVLYTDGVTELMNGDHQMWGERKFIRSLLASFNQGGSLDVAMADLSREILEHRQGAPLADDVTYFMFQYHSKVA